MSQAHAGGAQLLVLSGRDAPELKELTNLPDGMRLLATGRPGQELAGIASQHTRHAQHLAHVELVHLGQITSKVCQHSDYALLRLVKGGLGESGGSAEMWNRQRCVNQTGTSGECTAGLLFLVRQITTLLNPVHLRAVSSLPSNHAAGHLATPDKPQVDTFCISWGGEAPVSRTYQEQGAGDKCQGKRCLALHWVVRYADAMSARPLLASRAVNPATGVHDYASPDKKVLQGVKNHDLDTVRVCWLELTWNPK